MCVLLEGDERDVVAVEEADDAARELAVLRKLLRHVLQWLVRQLSDLQERTQQLSDLQERTQQLSDLQERTQHNSCS